MENLEIRIRTLEEHMDAVDFQGEIDIYNSSDVKGILARRIDEGSLRLIINLEQVRYIDSTGLGALLDAYERLRKKDGTMVLVCSNPRIVRIFKITGLHNKLNVFSDEADALAALRVRVQAVIEEG